MSTSQYRYNFGFGMICTQKSFAVLITARQTTASAKTRFWKSKRSMTSAKSPSTPQTKSISKTKQAIRITTSWARQKSTQAMFSTFKTTLMRHPQPRTISSTERANCMRVTSLMSQVKKLLSFPQPSSWYKRHVLRINRCDSNNLICVSGVFGHANSSRAQNHAAKFNQLSDTRKSQKVPFEAMAGQKAIPHFT